MAAVIGSLSPDIIRAIAHKTATEIARNEDSPCQSPAGSPGFNSTGFTFGESPGSSRSPSQLGSPNQTAFAGYLADDLPTVRLEKGGSKSKSGAAPEGPPCQKKFVERLWTKAAVYEQKNEARRQQKVEADESHAYAPRIKPHACHGCQERIEKRVGQITQEREDKLEKARALKVQFADEKLQSTKPTITSKGAGAQRGIEALQEWDKMKQEKNMIRQDQRAQEKLKECTFQPNVTSPLRKKETKNDTKPEEDGNIFQAAHVCKRLHDDAHRRHAEQNALAGGNHPGEDKANRSVLSNSPNSSPAASPNKSNSAKAAPRRPYVNPSDNDVVYSNVFDDVFRIGYGGPLPEGYGGVVS